jgi:hypothetical protein
MGLFVIQHSKRATQEEAGFAHPFHGREAYLIGDTHHSLSDGWPSFSGKTLAGSLAHLLLYIKSLLLQAIIAASMHCVWYTDRGRADVIYQS